MSRTFFSFDRKEKIFPCLPAPVRETRRWVLPRILPGSILVASLLSGDDVDRLLKLASTLRLPGWQHIDLSEAGGLVLSWVVREGIGITRRLSAQWALHAYRR